jgi:hypothetical protein
MIAATPSVPTTGRFVIRWYIAQISWCVPPCVASLYSLYEHPRSFSAIPVEKGNTVSG